MMDQPRRLLATDVLLALPAEGDCVRVPEVSEAIGRSRKDIARALDVLHRRGLVQRQRPGCYLVTAAGMQARDTGAAIKSGPLGPHSDRRKQHAQPTARDLAWRAMRRLEKFTLDDLIEIGEIGGRDPHSNLGRYLRGLQAAGYIRELRKRAAGTARTSNGHKRYLLIVNSGPLAPRISGKRGDIYDPNTHESHAITGGSAQ